MSLIVCKKINEKIYIESDSRITDINAARKESLRGVLKTIILHPRISISYSGNIYVAEKAIQEIFSYKKLTVDYLIDTLFQYNKENDNTVAFILCIISKIRLKLLELLISKLKEILKQHGNFGVLFCPKLDFKGIVFSNVSNLSFLEKVNEKYNIPLRGFIMRDNSSMQLIDMRLQEKIS